MNGKDIVTMDQRFAPLIHKADILRKELMFALMKLHQDECSHLARRALEAEELCPKH
jgi:hypothetical protein